MMPIYFVGQFTVFILGLAFLLLWNGAKQNKACLMWGVAHLALAIASATGLSFQQNGSPLLAAISVVSISIFLVTLFNANRALLGKVISVQRILSETLALVVLLVLVGFGVDQLAGRVLVSLMTVAVYSWSAILFIRRFDHKWAGAGFAFKALSFAVFFADMKHFSTYDQEGWTIVVNWAGSIALGLILVSVGVNQTRRRLEQALKHLPDAVVARQEDGAILFCNEKFSELMGFRSPTDAVGKKIVQVTGLSESARHVIEEVNVALAGGSHEKPIVLEREVESPGGKRLDLEVIVSTFVDFGQLVVIGVMRDLTARRQAERDKLALAQESTKRFERLYNSMLDGFSYTDMQGKITLCSEAYRAMVGYSDQDLKELPYGALTPPVWHPMDHQIIAEQVLVRGYSDLYEKEYIHKDGHTFPVELRIYLDRNERGDPVGFWAIVRDISRRKAAEQGLKDLNASLEDRIKARTQELEGALTTLKATQQDLIQSEKLASLGAMVAGVAHELNTPIGNAVLMASSLQVAQAEMADEMLKGLRRSSLERFVAHVGACAQMIERNLSRAADLVQSFKQVAVDQSSYMRREFLLADVIRETLTSLGPALRKAGVEVQESVSPDLRMDSWPGPLIQVLMNLINNAMLHGFEGRAGTIVLTATPHLEDQVQLVVADTGVGISPANLPKVFDPFFTTKLGKGGSGLGMHIVYSLVTGLLGGRIKLDSTVGQGTRVAVTIPLRAPQRVPGEVVG